MPERRPLRVRFAPSPTGSLHLGGARIAVLNWLLARRSGGTLVLRIEDTDRERNVAGAERAILDDLLWLGLDWDEGPEVGGPRGPYRQSERGDVYRAAAARLVDAGAAYWCTCPPQPEAAGADRARCPCAGKPPATSPPAGASLRFRVPGGDVAVHDEVRGEIVFPEGSIEDFVLVRSDGRPTYNLAATVDDAAMEIDLVARGSDHLANTPKQALLYRALDRTPPRFVHVPLILGADRQKLSKRHGATSIAEHRRLGYLPEALVNYLSLLSWSSASGDEFLPRERLVREIDLARLGSADAVFDPEKLRWLSGRHLQSLPLEALVERVLPFVDRARVPIPAERMPTAVSALRERISLLSEAEAWLGFFLGPRGEAQRGAADAARSDPAAAPALEATRRALAALPTWDEAAISTALKEAGKASGLRGRPFFGPLRLALTGEVHGPELVKILYVLGRERCMALLARPGSFDDDSGGV